MRRSGDEVLAVFDERAARVEGAMERARFGAREFMGLAVLVIRPLPFGEAERLVTLYETNPEFGWDDANAAPANMLDWREQVEAFEDVSASSFTPVESLWSE